MEKVGIDIQANFTDNASQGMDSLAQRLRQRVQQMESATRDYESSVERFALTRKSNLKTQLQSQVEAKYGRIESISEEIEKEGLAGRPEIIAVTDRERLERARAIYKAQSEGLISGKKPRAVDNPFSFSVMDVGSYGSTELLRANISELKKETLGVDEKGAFTTVSQDLLSRVRSRYASGLTRGLSELESEREKISKLPADQQQSALDELANKQDRLVKTSLASAKSIQEFSDSLSEFSDATKKAKGGLPSYFMAAVGAGLQIAQSAGQLYHLNQTSFDLNSPTGMVNALYGKEMGQRSILSKGIGGTLGLLGGFALAPATGGGSLLASLGFAYAGQQVGEGIGGLYASVANTGTEVEQKRFNAITGRMQSNVGLVNSKEASERNLRRFSNSTISDFLKLDGSYAEQNAAQLNFARLRGSNNAEAFSELRSYAGKTIPFADIAPIASTYKFTGKDIGAAGLDNLVKQSGMKGREDEIAKSIIGLTSSLSGRFTDKDELARNLQFMANLPASIYGSNSEAGKLSDTGMSRLNALQGITTPSSPAQEALLFRALKQQNPGMNFTDIQLQMRKGFTKENLSALMSVLPKDETYLKQYLMTTAPNLPSGDIATIAKQMAAGTFGNMPESKLYGELSKETADQLLQKGLGDRTRGETSQIEQMISGTKAGEKSIDLIINMETQWTKSLNQMATDSSVIDMIAKKFTEAMTEMQNSINSLKPVPVYTPQWQGAGASPSLRKFDNGR